MSEYRPRRGRNWYSAMGVLFIVVGAIVIVQNLIIWSPEFVLDFMINSEFTNENPPVNRSMPPHPALKLGVSILAICVSLTLSRAKILPPL